MLAERETSQLSKELIEKTCEKQGIQAREAAALGPWRADDEQDSEPAAGGFRLGAISLKTARLQR